MSPRSAYPQRVVGAVSTQGSVVRLSCSDLVTDRRHAHRALTAEEVSERGITKTLVCRFNGTGITTSIPVSPTTIPFIHRAQVENVRACRTSGTTVTPALARRSRDGDCFAYPAPFIDHPEWLSDVAASLPG